MMSAWLIPFAAAVAIQIVAWLLSPAPTPPEQMESSVALTRRQLEGAVARGRSRDFIIRRMGMSGRKFSK